MLDKETVQRKNNRDDIEKTSVNNDPQFVECLERAKKHIEDENVRECFDRAQRLKEDS